MVVEYGVLTEVTDEDIELLKTNPDKFWRGVTKIGDSAFKDVQGMTSIVIPEGVKSIGVNAFIGNNLISVKMPSTLESIGKSAFAESCSLKEVDMPNVKTIGDWAFCGCDSLEKIILPDGLEQIGDDAFGWCKNLKEIVIPGSVKVLPNFPNCESLETVKLCPGVTEIRDNAFSRKCENLENIEIPEGVTIIGADAFWHCYKLNNVVLPESVTIIGEQAFASCVALESIVIPSNVTEIKERTFYSCHSLKKVEIKNGVKEIKPEAFHSCISLKSVSIPDSVEKIGTDAFYLCGKLTSIDIPGSVKIIDKYAFNSCGLTTVNIQNGVKTIGAFAFLDCSHIKNIVIPESVEEIEYYAFRDCFCMQSASIPMSVKRIDPEAFSKCGFRYIYFNDKEIFLSEEEDETKVGYECVEYNEKNTSKIFNSNFRQNYIQVHKWKEENKIRFIPPNYLLSIFPSDQIENFFINNNNQRWGRLVKELGFNEYDIFLPELLKIYYALGGFSENQGECEKAYKYIVEYVAKKPDSDYSYGRVAEEIHQKFSKLELNGPYNKDFAQFFMRYYKDDKSFMSFDLDGDGKRDYLCEAHNRFNHIQKAYPYRVVTGNTERELLSPQFVAEHCTFVIYDDVEEGNEALAELVGKYGYSQEQFEKMQEMYAVAKKEKSKYVIMADKAKETDSVKFRLLDKDDPLGFVLGDITNCCQHIGGAGGSCVDDGYTNPEAGFLVFEESVKDENGNDTGEKVILAQAYIWYDPVTKTVCYDNIEIPTEILNRLRKGKDGDLTTAELLDAVERSAEAIMHAMNKNGVMVKKVTTGEGYNDLRTELKNRGYVRETEGLASHGGYDGYTDADEAQYVIKTYDQVTTECAEETKKDAEKARTSLKDIFRAIKNRLTGKDL